MLKINHFPILNPLKTMYIIPNLWATGLRPFTMTSLTYLAMQPPTYYHNMIKSKFIFNVVDLLLDGNAEGRAVRSQIQYLTDDKYQHTDDGLIVSFFHGDEIYQHRSCKGDIILNGVEIKSTETRLTANASLYFKKGIIDSLKINCYRGTFPKKELKQYTLTLIWHI